MKNKYEQRIERLQAKFAAAGIDGLYINHVENVSYFTGKKGNDCTLWITPTRATILTDFRYREMAQELTWLNFYETSGSARPIDLLQACPYKKIGVERSALVVTAAFDEAVSRVTANLARAAAITAGEADVYTVLKYKTIVCDKAGFDALVKRMGAVKKEAK